MSQEKKMSSARVAISRYHDICAGHRVVGHEGKCRGLHGHNWRITFHLSAPRLDSVGRVLDFGVIKARLCEWLETNWDHHFLMWRRDPILPDVVGDLLGKVMDESVREEAKAVVGSVLAVPFNPTSENMAAYLLTVIGPQQLEGTGAELVAVEVRETEKCTSVAYAADEKEEQVRMRHSVALRDEGPFAAADALPTRGEDGDAALDTCPRVAFSEGEVAALVKSVRDVEFPDGMPPDYVLGVLSGGMTAAQNIALLLRVGNMGFVWASHYDGTKERPAEDRRIGKLPQGLEKAQNVLIVDDVVETGWTVEGVKEAVHEINEKAVVRAFALVGKGVESILLGDVKVGKILPKSVWVSFPWAAE